ncbi:MAG: thermonuclease family protein [Alphaproteobacteria bacterium]|nr:thermonuclease family protein [Alphaproteobacteria bacterium]
MLLIATSVAAIDRTSIVGQASVIDGDTIEIHGQRIRLHGIDAPEGRQTCIDARGTTWRCGQKVALTLSDKIARQTVECEPRDRDRWRRVIAICRVAGIDLNGWLVSEGLAVAFRRYSLDYVPQEDAARRSNRGLWAGTFVMPAEWRRTKRWF